MTLLSKLPKAFGLVLLMVIVLFSVPEKGMTSMVISNLPENEPFTAIQFYRGNYVADPQINNIRVDFYFARGKSLKGCTMSELGVVMEDGLFTVDLQNYLTKGCNFGTAVDDDFLLPDLEMIVLEPTTQAVSVRIRRLEISAIYPQGDARLFYRNESVNAEVKKINNADALAQGYPNHNSNCLGNASYQGFSKDNSVHQRPPSGGSVYFPHPLGKLVFSKQDLAYDIEIKTDDRQNSGTLNTLHFRATSDCADNASFVSIPTPDLRNRTLGASFYSHAITPNEIQNGFKFYLNSTAGNDLLISDYYKVTVREAWSLTGEGRKYSREYNGACSRTDRSDCFTLEGGQTKSYQWQVNGELVDL